MPLRRASAQLEPRSERGLEPVPDRSGTTGIVGTGATMREVGCSAPHSGQMTLSSGIGRPHEVHDRLNWDISLSSG